MKKPYKISREIPPIEFQKLHLPRAIPRIYLVNQIRGRADLKEGFATVPKWAEDKGKDYLLYYIAHEMSHLLAETPHHNFAFYKMFIQICPEELQHHELKYKPSAGKFGIRMKGLNDET